jgi:universal stress protein E
VVRFVRDFKNILCYTDADEKDGAIHRAVRLAIENDASLTLMHVIKPIPRALGTLTTIADAEELQRLVADDHREQLLTMASEYLDTGVPINVIITIGDAATEIVRQVIAEGHDLVVRAAEDLSPFRRLFGSVARSLLRICPCPVWVVTPHAFGDFDRVLAAVDVEAADQPHRELNRHILNLAFSIAQTEHAELHIVSAWDLWMEQSLRRRAGHADIDFALADHERKVRIALDQMLQVPDANIDNFHVHHRKGHPATVIRSVAEEVRADLMVMGTVCRTGAAGFLIGNTAETLLADMTCSVLALKPDGFVSPVQASAELASVGTARALAR